MKLVDSHCDPLKRTFISRFASGFLGKNELPLGQVVVTLVLAEGSALQMRTVSSCPDETRYFPSGENEMWRTSLSCPRKTEVSCQLWVSQSLIVSSPLALASAL